jgi:endonuclease YncB( thermonuclease family)
MKQDPAQIEQFLRRRKISRRVLGVAALLLAASILLGNTFRQIRGGDDWSRVDRRPMVVQAVQSGCRLVVANPDGSNASVVWLHGAAIPDVAAHGQPQAPGALEAYRALRDLAQGKAVIVRLPTLDPHAADGSIRGYVYLLDNRQEPTSESINERLIADGHAYADRRSEHPFHKQFEQAEGEARRKKLGLWAYVRDSEQPAWRQQWLKQLQSERANKR